MKKSVIYFDGVCGLCNGFIDFVMSVDQRQHFLFSPLQSDYARDHLPPPLTADLKTIVVQIDDQTYTKASAVIEVLTQIGGIWKIAGLGRMIPNFLSNRIYDLVAQNRYQLFGKKDTCRLPTPEERQRFIM